MSPLKKSQLIILSAIILLTACVTQKEAPAATATPVPSPTATATPLPTPSLPNDSILWGELQVTMVQLEITGEYLTDFGSTRVPPAGQKFLWVQVQLKNMGKIEMDVPIPEHYSILYAGSEIKPIYGHRNGYVDYTNIDPTIYPAQELDGWLRFDIPDKAELRDLQFVFLPESAQVGVSYTSPSYPYADNRSTFVWDCAR